MFAGDDMAEDLLGRILRDDEEAPAVKAPEALAGPEAFAAAIADHASSQNPEVARQLAALLVSRRSCSRFRPSTSSISTGCGSNTFAISYAKRGRDYRLTYF
jgi:hypothetical protein